MESSKPHFVSRAALVAAAAGMSTLFAMTGTSSRPANATEIVVRLRSTNGKQMLGTRNGDIHLVSPANLTATDYLVIVDLNAGTLNNGDTVLLRNYASDSFVTAVEEKRVRMGGSLQAAQRFLVTHTTARPARTCGFRTATVSPSRRSPACTSQHVRLMVVCAQIQR